MTVLITGAFYLIGSDALTALVGYRAGEWLHALGAGSRFASITRGVLDLRDLYYYLSITAAFLLLNRLALEQLRWAGNRGRRQHRRWYWLVALLAANLLGANLWLGPDRRRAPGSDGGTALHAVGCHAQLSRRSCRSRC